MIHAVDSMGATSAPGLGGKSSSLTSWAGRALTGGPVALGKVPLSRPPVALGKVPLRAPAYVQAKPAAVAALPPPPKALGRVPISAPPVQEAASPFQPQGAFAGGGGGGGSAASGEAPASLAPVAGPVAAAAPEAPTSTGFLVGAGVLALALGLGVYLVVR